MIFDCQHGLCNAPLEALQLRKERYKDIVKIENSECTRIMSKIGMKRRVIAQTKESNLLDRLMKYMDQVSLFMKDKILPYK